MNRREESGKSDEAAQPNHLRITNLREEERRGLARGEKLKGYSHRSATTGSSLAARRAGI